MPTRPLLTDPARRRSWMLCAISSLSTGIFGGCSSTERAQPYESREWLQSSTNRIANLSLRDNIESVKRVQQSLYRRNPREWRKWAPSMDEAIARTWDAVTKNLPLLDLLGLNGATGIDAIRMAFDTGTNGTQGFQGDRVAALAIGWATLIKQANGNTWQQTMLNGTDAENSYRAARNIEISLWLLNSRTGANGQPLLLSTEISERGRNLVADRELSKIVARLDLLAAQADEKYRRAALDFSQSWLTGNIMPFLSMIPR